MKKQGNQDFISRAQKLSPKGSKWSYQDDARLLALRLEEMAQSIIDKARGAGT